MNVINQRLAWLDYCKVIAIYLVILGHTSICSYVEQFIYVFHMPLFFFMSGYVFSFEKFSTYKQFFQKNISTLLLPYILLNLITYIFWLFISSRVGADTTDKNFYMPLIAIFYGHPKSLLHDIPLWFLLAMFVVRCIFFICYKNNGYALPNSILVLLAVIAIYSFEWFGLPLCLDIAIIALPIFALGYYARKKNITFENYIVFGIMLIILISTYFFNGKVAMHVSQYNNLILFYLGGLAGCYTLFFICKKVYSIVGKCGKLLSFIAANTLLICAFHLPTFTFLKGILLYAFNKSPKIIDDTIFPNVIFALVSLGLCLCISYYVNKYAPVLCGYRCDYSHYKDYRNYSKNRTRI